MISDDIKTGRKARAVFGSVSVGTSVIQLLGSNPFRIALLISSHATNAVTISNQGTFTAGNGIVIPSGAQALQLDVIKHGSLVTAGLNIISAGSSTTIGYCEITSEDI